MMAVPPKWLRVARARARACLPFALVQMPPCPLLKRHLSDADQQWLLEYIRKPGSSVAQACKLLGTRRAARGERPVHKTSIYRFLRGKTHQRGKAEKRGRPRALRPADVRRLTAIRRRLVQQANNEHTVTYQDALEASGLAGEVSTRTVADALRGAGVRFRRPREKAHISELDAKERLRVARDWIRRPRSFWSEGIHAYVDNKSWPLPLTRAQRQRYKQTLVHGHLRTRSEGVERGFTKARMRHSFLGLPSVTVTAAVGKGRILLWHVHDGPWNGARAAALYAGPLIAALRKTWGRRRTFTIIEDGDRKGNMSGRGIKAKEEVGIRALTLPPRTPSWMPLDYALWRQIEERMTAQAPEGSETREAYLQRLRRCALSLPRSLIEKTVERVKDNIQGVMDAQGFGAKKD